jgi:hypothetical protein
MLAIRKATPDDVPAVLRLVEALAAPAAQGAT